jgi:hypothetical protein
MDREIFDDEEYEDEDGESLAVYKITRDEWLKLETPYL